MKVKITSLTKPYLSIIDNGLFFRKPISWLYLVLAAISAIAPIYLIYVAINLNSAYFKLENSKVKLEAFAPQFENIRLEYDSISVNYNKQLEAIQAASNNYSEMNSYAENAKSYLMYGSYYAQNYEDYRSRAESWLTTWKSLEKTSQVLAKKLEVLKPKYEKNLSIFNTLNAEYQNNSEKYNIISPAGAFHTSDNKTASVIGLVLFCIFIICIGLLNVLILLNRSNDLKQLNSDNDKFTAIPVLSHFIQTMGEYIGTYIATMGFATVLIAVAFKTCFGTFGLEKLYAINLEQLSTSYQYGIPYLFVPLVAAFFTLWLSKIVAEAIKTVVAIANNTGATLNIEK